MECVVDTGQPLLEATISHMPAAKSEESRHQGNEEILKGGSAQKAGGGPTLEEGRCVVSKDCGGGLLCR